MFSVGIYINAIDKITGNSETVEISSWQRRRKAERKAINKIIKEYESKRLLEVK